MRSFWGRDVFNYRRENRFDVEACFGGYMDGLGGIELEIAGYLGKSSRRVGGGEVDFINNGNEG